MSPSSGIAATPGSSLPSRSSSEAPPPVETQEIRVGEPELLDRAHGVAAADDGVAVGLGDRLGDRVRARRRSASHSNTPIGPFQKTVCAAPMMRRERVARSSGPMSRPSQPSGTSSYGATRRSASAANDAAATTSDGQLDRKRRADSRRGAARPSCRRRSPCLPARLGAGGRRACRRPWRRRQRARTGARRRPSSRPRCSSSCRAAAPRTPEAGAQRPRSRRARGVPSRTRRSRRGPFRRRAPLHTPGRSRLARVEARVLEHRDPGVVERALRARAATGAIANFAGRPRSSAGRDASTPRSPTLVVEEPARGSEAPHGCACRRRRARRSSGTFRSAAHENTLPADVARSRTERGAPQAAALRAASDRRRGRRAGSCSPTRCRTSRRPWRCGRAPSSAAVEDARVRIADDVGRDERILEY